VEIPKEGLKLNIAAGGKRYPGWIGVDAVSRSGADIIGTMDKVPLPDSCANEIMVIHGVEHIFSWEVPAALAEWFRLMRPGAKLILEMPDMLKACKNIAEGIKGDKHPDQQGMWAIWGDDRQKDPLMMHKAGWWFKRLKPVVESAGFQQVTEHVTKFHPVGRERRDFRLEAYKP
jgi:predicted SAM-dependent methyltransferase